MIVDFDDFCLEDNRLDLLWKLREANPEFRCTLFAIPGKGTELFWETVPEWCELAVHGWMHPTPTECKDWTYERAVQMILDRPSMFVRGFKAPGWQISDGTYEALVDHGWWVADHYDNNRRRPVGIFHHLVTPAAANGLDPDHWHGHIPNVCGNGIEETFSRLVETVRRATSFEFVSECVS